MTCVICQICFSFSVCTAIIGIKLFPLCYFLLVAFDIIDAFVSARKSSFRRPIVTKLYRIKSELKWEFVTKQTVPFNGYPID